MYPHLQESVPDSKIKLNSPVCKLFWDQPEEGNKVLVVTQAGDSYLASHVIVTASIGHLKERHADLFEPQLPQAYRDAMDVRASIWKTRMREYIPLSLQ